MVMALRQVFMANVRNRRKQMGLTQEKLAELCDTDPCYIRQIEIGRRFPSLEYIERIAKALNTAPYLLFYEETNPENDELSPQYAEQKRKIKTELAEVVARITSVIDELH